MKVNLLFASFSAVYGMIGSVSLLVGKTPYLGFFGQKFIARRKWDPGHFWSMIAQYFAFCAICAVLAIFIGD